jgi:hypothetical protein
MLKLDRDRPAPALAPHQAEAVDRLERILSARRGAVLADEPGLGKTWVAAAVAEKWSGRGATIDVVVPAALRGYWSDVLSMFGVSAVVRSHESLAGVVRTDHRDGVPALVIVDEAHRFRNPLTKRHDGLARLSVNARLLLVTATPVCNAPPDLLSLLGLLVADDELAGLGVASLAAAFGECGAGLDVVIGELVVRRSTSEVDVSMPSRADVVIEYEPIERPDAFADQLSRLTFPWMDDRTRGDLPRLFLERRLESSVAAFAATVRRMKRVCRRAQALAAKGACLTATELRRVLGDPDAPLFQDILFPELWGARSGRHPVDGRRFDEEVALLDQISASLPREVKCDLLAALVRERRGIAGLVFTVSYDTASSLFEEMSSEWRCALLTGRGCVIGASRSSIDGIVRALRNRQVDLVIATDLGSVGLNLQNAGFVVHYDQPWNPAVVEQRNGRVCRIGQARTRVDSIELVPRRGRARAIINEKRRVNERFWSLGGEVPWEPSSPGNAWRLPSRIEAWRSQAVLARRLRATGTSTGELIELLSIRHRSGVERMLERAAHESFDRATIERLLGVLRAETSMIATHGAAI